ncbi:MAG: YncE family protein [Dehalococcoidia bacterium]
MNRIATLAILPMMTIAIVVFSRYADSGGSKAEPPSSGVIVVANLRTESLDFLDLSSGDLKQLHLPGPPHEMLVSGGRIYVTLGRGNALVEVEPNSAAILRVLHLEGEPHGLAVWGENLVVTLDKGNEAVVLDRASLTELRRYPTGNTPHVVAVSDQAVLVTDSRDNRLRQIQPASATIPTGAQPEGIAIVGSDVVTADAFGNTITIARASDLSGAARLEVTGPVRVMALDETTALVSSQSADRVVVVNVANRKIVRSLSTGGRPDGLCPSPAGEYFGSASNGDGKLTVFSTSDWKLAAEYEFEAGLGSCVWLNVR